jgi:hypothetical protein
MDSPLMRWRLSLLLLAAGLIGAIGAGGLTWTRLAGCRPVPLLAGERLPNADLSTPGEGGLPRGWAAGAPGVVLRRPAVDHQGFETDGDGRALQLLGIGNYVETPPIPVRSNVSYCFSARALTDSVKGSSTRLRVTFRWLDAAGHPLAADATDWQPLALWTPANPPREWSPIGATFRAPPGAAMLRVRLQPSSDDRVYLDALHAQWTPTAQRGGGEPPPAGAADTPAVVISPWPNGARGALSFSFDWETAMGGLIHSRSVDDPNSAQDPLVRAMRMRAGVTTTLDIFRTYSIRATYYATGYNFLTGNTERQQFMGNPTFAWADRTTSGKWPNDAWAHRPWFADDPYGTVASDPGWYFGDLIAPLRRAGQDIQSHTFSHLDGGLARTAEWQADLAAWREVAAQQGVPPARSLAFPWSSSAGMSDADWQALEAAGITSVTRTKPGQPQYQLASPAEAQCRPVPGHERILACPDFYLTTRSAPQARLLLDRIAGEGGMIDLWAHTEEVTSPEQIAAWRDVVAHAAALRDAGKLWIAPLAEIADRQQAVAKVRVQQEAVRNQGNESLLSFTISNPSRYNLNELALRLPFRVRQVAVNGTGIRSAALVDAQTAILDLPAGTTLEVTALAIQK